MSSGRAAHVGGRVPAMLLLAVLAASGSGCRTVVDTVAGVFGPGDVGGTVDAHVVYRLRADCPALLARTLSNGYTVLTPRETLGATGPVVEQTGVFEGPVRTGEVVFRYIMPEEPEATEPIDIIADVDAVRLGIEAGQERIVALCGPLPATTTPDDIPRIPGQ